ncbi:MAG: AAA family ATPase, partial [Nitrospinae bacterium]|nr:AAA family ATPase [Nitrospinota bacterium]
MYENFFGFREKPFSLTPDPKFFYLSRQHQGALDHMLYGIKRREGFMVIVGDVGTGKTTLCRCLLDKLDKSVEVALILNPMLSDMDLLKTCVQDLRVGPVKQRAESLVTMGTTDDKVVMLHEPEEPEVRESGSWVENASKRELLDALNNFLLNQHEQGKSTVLIVDEAQNLPLDVMELLRLLSNLETEKEKLLQIIFVGQLELEEKLKLPELKQLNQRISIRYKISPLNRNETNNYISHRILVASGASSVSFARAAVTEVYSYSKGYPRLINLVCDRALLAGFNSETDLIAKSHVRQGIRSLLGEEDKGHFIRQFLKDRLPLIASVIFFLMGLVFFLIPKESLNLRTMRQAVSVIATGLTDEEAGEQTARRKKTKAPFLPETPA